VFFGTFDGRTLELETHLTLGEFRIARVRLRGYIDGNRPFAQGNASRGFLQSGCIADLGAPVCPCSVFILPFISTTTFH